MSTASRPILAEKGPSRPKAETSNTTYMRHLFGAAKSGILFAERGSSEICKRMCPPPLSKFVFGRLFAPWSLGGPLRPRYAANDRGGPEPP